MKLKDLEEIAKAFFKSFDSESTVEVSDEKSSDGSGSNWWVKVQSPNSGRLIGKNGETLQAIQYIVRLMASEKAGEFTPVTVDVAGYKENKEKEIIEFALAMAENVKNSGYAQEMRPMTPYERRIVHVALKNFEGITADSVGEGMARRIRIEPIEKE